MNIKKSVRRTGQFVVNVGQATTDLVGEVRISRKVSKAQRSLAKAGFEITSEMPSK
jgi:hypothetical protein